MRRVLLVLVAANGAGLVLGCAVGRVSLPSGLAEFYVSIHTLHVT
jgi:hypothetical protein